MRIIAAGTGALAVACLLSSAVPAEDAAAPDTSAFTRACLADQTLAPKAGSPEALATVCACITDRYSADRLAQDDVDVLTRWRAGTLNSDDITPALRDVLTYTFGVEKACLADPQAAP